MSAAATPVSIDPLHCAYARLLAAVGKNRPRKLHADNSPCALAGRVADIEAQLIACTDWLKAIVDDTSHHCHARRRLDDIVDAYMADMAGELRGELLKAMENAA